VSDLKFHNMRVHIEESPQGVAGEALEMFTHLAEGAARQGRLFRTALSGGSTPKLLYGLLASETLRDEVPWSVVCFFFGDERWVPPTHPESNYKLANDNLFKKVSVDPACLFPIPTEGLTPAEAAAQYEETLRREFGTGEDQVPEFDLIFLGMGDDAHTASCFPHTSVIKQREKLVEAVFVEKLDTHRITLTPPVLQAARSVLVMVTGESKAEALREVMLGEYNPDEYPAQLLRHSHGSVTWLVDKSAASKLEGE
jgi:6-phosphogluconolactonase